MDYFKEINDLQNNVNADLKAYIIRFCAHCLLPVTKSQILSLCKQQKWTEKKSKLIIQELLQEKRLEKYSSTREGYYCLPCEDYPRYFQTESTLEYNSFNTLCSSLDDNFHNINSIRSQLFKYAKNNARVSSELHLYGPRTLFFTIVIAFMLTSERWHPILNAIDDIERSLHLNQLAIYAEVYSSSLSIVERLEKILKSRKLTADSRASVNSILYHLTHCVQGNISTLPPVLPHCAYSHYSQALYQQYQGNAAKAVTLYQKGVKIEQKLFGHCLNDPTDRYSPQSSFYALMYHIALSQDHRASAPKKLDSISVHYFFNSAGSRHIASMLFILQREEDTRTLKKLIAEVKEKALELSSMQFALAILIMNHYSMVKIPKEWEQRAVEDMREQNWLLLLLEASTGMPSLQEEQESLSEQLKLTPVLKKHVILEPWQRKLNDIELLLQTQANSSKSGKKPSSTAEHQRIVYLIDSEENLSPLLQKSKDGEKWSKGRAIALSRMAKGSVEGMSSTDQAVALTITKSTIWGNSDYHLGSPSSFAALIDHPHIYLESNPDISVQVKLDSPYLEIQKTSKGYKVKSNVTPEYNELLIIDRASDTLLNVYKLSGIQRDILKLFAENDSYPLAAEEQLRELTHSIAGLITVHSDLIDKSAQLSSREGSTRITVQILPMVDGVKVELFSKPLEQSPPYFKAGKGMKNCIVPSEEGQITVSRDLKKERANYTKVRNILREVADDRSVEDTLIFNELYDCLDLLERLQGMDDVLRIEWPKGARLKIRGQVDFSQMQISTRSRGEWFMIDGEVHVDEQLQLSFADLLKYSRAHQGRFVELEKGEFIALSEKLRKKLAEIDNSLQSEKKDELQISKFRSSLLSDLEDQGSSLSADRQYKKLQQRIEQAYSQQITIPSTLTAQLRDYQVEGYEWLSRLAAWGAGACLADDMGLGKSVQSIAVLLDRASQGASLIVAPASIIHNWRQEIARFAPSLQCHLLHESEQREEVIQQAGPFDIIITTYGLLSRVATALKEKSWNVLLLDEAHNIKNRDTKSSKTAMSLQSEFRLALTGTPVQNHLGEIWNLFNFTNPGLLGSFEKFTQKFIIPIEKDKNRARQQQLKHILQPFLLRRTKSEVLDELPAKTEIVHYVELSAEERAIYENIRRRAIQTLEQGELSPIQTLAEITKLRQAACHPLLIDDTLKTPSSAKLTRLAEIVSELIENKHRALVFSQFTSFLAQAIRLLDTLKIPYLYLDGQTPVKQRAQLVEQFQRGDTPLFLISLKAGGTGLNLTAADYVIHLDPWWNPAIEDQASDRSHRMGQTRPVTIYKIIASQTIEERILEMHKNKKSLSDSLLEGGNISTKLTKKEILRLLEDNLS